MSENEQQQNPLLQALSTGSYCPFRNGACAKTCTFFNRDHQVCELMVACKSIYAIAYLLQSHIDDADDADVDDADADDDTADDDTADTADDDTADDDTADDADADAADADADDADTDDADADSKEV